MASNLAPAELFKHQWRIDIFLKKYQNQEPFELTSGQTVTFVPDQTIIKALKSENRTVLQTSKLITTDSQQVSLSQLKKTKDFGGKDSRFGVRLEDAEITSINNQLDKLRSELTSPTIPLVFRNKVYQVYDLASTPGTPKSDFHFRDMDGRDVLWVSHKAGRSPKDFQQWSGMTEAVIKAHPEVNRFIKKVQDLFPKAMPRATTVARAIKDPRLMNHSVYGINYGGSYGINNVNWCIQGAAQIVPTKGGYTLQGSTMTHENGENIYDGYAPTLMAMYKGDRDNFNVKGARFAIQPRDSRSVTLWI